MELGDESGVEFFDFYGFVLLDFFVGVGVEGALEEGSNFLHMLQRQIILYITIRRLHLVPQIMHREVELIAHDPRFLNNIFHINLRSHYFRLHPLSLQRLHAFFLHAVQFLLIVFKPCVNYVVIPFEQLAPPF